MSGFYSQIMWIVCFFVMYVYNIFFFYYTCSVLHTRMKRWKVVAIFPICVTGISMWLISGRVFLPLLNLITMAIYMLSFLLAFSESIFNNYILCLNTVFHLIKLRGFTIAIIAVCLNKSMREVNQNTIFYLFSFIITSLTMFIVGVFFDNGVNLQKVKTMLLHKSTLFTIVTTKTTLVVLMMNMEYINNYMLGATTTALVAVICYILINTCFYCLLIMTYKSIQWIENEMVHEITEMQLEYQKQLYNKQNECEGLLRIYKHDYKSILENSVRFIENGEPEEARRLLMQTDDQLMQIIRKQSRNSNSLIVDVILSGLEEKCAQENIEFFGNCYIPEGIHISELEFSRIFNNMANNAYEACMRQDTKEYKWISFRSYVKDKKLVIYQKNSFNGIVRYEKEKLGTTKVDQKLHGIGMNSIQYTVEALDGMFMFKADQEKKVFEILIKIPLKQ